MNAHILPDQPSDWVVRFAPLVGGGEVLDLACGKGRHARYFAASDHRVVALDRDGDALAGLVGQGIETVAHDLEQPGAAWPFAAQRFAAILVTNYLHRPLFPHILRSLAPDGVLIYETFAQGNERFGKPANPDFLLAPGELLDIVRTAIVPLRVIAFEDGHVMRPRPAMVQRICARMPQAEPGPFDAGRLRLF